MSEEALSDDQSHYEVSLTAGQAFLAFVLLLLSLAAAFAFGLVIGRGQADDRLTARKETPVVNETSAIPRKAAAREVAVKDDDFKQPEIKEEPKPKPGGGQPPAAAKAKPQAPPAGAAGGGGAPQSSASHSSASVSVAPHEAFAQLLSTSDQKTAEAMAAKLIDGGFTSAYVERGTTEKGMIFRVRVKFSSEAEARSAEARLRGFSREVWITK